VERDPGECQSWLVGLGFKGRFALKVNKMVNKSAAKEFNMAFDLLVDKNNNDNYFCLC